MKGCSDILDAPNAAYIHIPFCKSKCTYCDFNSYAGMESLWEAYVEALLIEIRQTATSEQIRPLETVYFGGGTPTILPPDSLVRLLDAVADSFGLCSDAEISIEANPGTVSAESLRMLRASGFNRLSLGVQSFNDRLLRRIGRVHTAEEAVMAYEDARDSGFRNIGIDLIFALPGQDLADWESDLQELVKLLPEHASLYELTICEDTPLGKEILSGKLAVPDEDAKLDMLLMGLDALTSAGYERYEISNYAIPGFACRHNQTYWRNEAYYGFGAGACSYINGVRRSNVKAPNEYLSLLSSGGSPIDWSEITDDKQSVVETLMLALRTVEGLNLRNFARKFGYAFEDAYRQEMAELQAHKWLIVENGHMRPTNTGILMADEIAARFL